MGAQRRRKASSRIGVAFTVVAAVFLVLLAFNALRTRQRICELRTPLSWLGVEPIDNTNGDDNLLQRKPAPRSEIPHPEYRSDIISAMHEQVGARMLWEHTRFSAASLISCRLQRHCDYLLWCS
jgi:hypothetical protein